MATFDPKIYLGKQEPVEKPTPIPPDGFDFEPDPELKPIIEQKEKWEDEEVIPEYVELRIKTSILITICTALGLTAFAATYLWIEYVWLR